MTDIEAVPILEADVVREFDVEAVWLTEIEAEAVPIILAPMASAEIERKAQVLLRDTNDRSSIADETNAEEIVQDFCQVGVEIVRDFEEISIESVTDEGESLSEPVAESIVKSGILCLIAFTGGTVIVFSWFWLFSL